MWNRIKGFREYLDYAAILLGAAALVLSIFGCDCDWLVCVAGFVCFVYSVSGLYLLCRRPKLDWLLIYGNFLRKVVAYVLLVPSFVTTVFMIVGSISSVDYSAKNIVYAENLYECEQKADTLCVANSKMLADPLFLQAHDLTLLGDSVVVQNHTLSKTEIGQQQVPSMFWSVFYHFVDPGNQDMATSQSGRGWAAIIAMLGVFLLNGLLVSSIVGWFDSRKDKWLKGEVKYPCFLRWNKNNIM